MRNRKMSSRTYAGCYRVEHVTSSAHQWRLMELKKPAKGRARYTCIAIGTGYANMERLARKLS